MVCSGPTKGGLLNTVELGLISLASVMQVSLTIMYDYSVAMPLATVTSTHLISCFTWLFTGCSWLPCVGDLPGLRHEVWIR